MDKEQFKRVKLEAIANNIKEAANSIAEALKELPKGKAYKNVFVKTYNRRPMLKQKTKAAKYKIAINTAYYVIQHRVIASQPYFTGIGKLG